MFGLLLTVFVSIAAYAVVDFYFLQLTADKKELRFLLLKLGIAIAIGCVGSIFRTFALFLVHLALLFIICRLGAFIYSKTVKNHSSGAIKHILRVIFKSGIIPIITVAIIFTLGYINISSVQKTSYTVTSDKLENNYRVVFISDIHYATVQDTAVLKNKVKEINKLKPDIVIFGGDIVDEGTSKADMQECFSVLGAIESTKGSYYVYGNHDRQRYSSSASYTENELKTAIESNGITVLQESFINIGDDLILLGREDLGSRHNRLTENELAAEIDGSKFILTADHQPNDTKGDAAIGTDLLLSGHTHGAQIFPLGYFTSLYSGFVYGEYQVDNMTVIVSSGFAGWGFPIRTQGVSEYLVVDLKSKLQVG